jgi:DNA polymerase/3'-5' exonuclease PolX
MKKLYAEEKILNCNTVISLVKIIQEEMQHSKEYTLQLRSFLDILLFKKKNISASHLFFCASHKVNFEIIELHAPTSSTQKLKLVGKGGQFTYTPTELFCSQDFEGK